MKELHYSTNEESFNYDDIHDAAEDALYDLKVGDTATIWVGEKEDNKASDFVRDITEDMGERAYDDIGEVSDMWPDSTVLQNEELQQAVDKLVDEWANKYNLHPTFFKITNVKKLTLELTNADTGAFKVNE